MELFELGFLSVSIIDLLDILLTAALIYTLFKIIRGSIAMNIFLGFLVIYVFWFITLSMNMRVLSTILGQFIGVGVIALLIVFQQEIRRFLLLIGKNRIFLGNKFTWKQLIPWNWKQPVEADINFDELARACKHMSRTLTGAIIVLARSSELKFFTSTGTYMDAEMSSKLLESIFMKKSPLHDGAVIMVKNRIMAASCILPVSESSELPAEFGLRHRSALGVAEQTDALIIIVSEETGRISLASKGQISGDISKVEDLAKKLHQEYIELQIIPEDAGMEANIGRA